MQTYKCEIEGITPLMQDKMSHETLLSLIPNIKGVKKKVKEELTPREIAEDHSYKNGNGYQIPSEYLRQAFIGASSEYKQKHSSRKSYKPIAGGIFRPQGIFIDLIDKKKKPITTFEVDIKKATNHQKGAVAAVRPRFDKWWADFTVEIDEDLIPQELALQILEDAGRRVGIGSYRVSKGGYFGQFQVVKWKKLNSK